MDSRLDSQAMGLANDTSNFGEGLGELFKEVREGVFFKMDLNGDFLDESVSDELRSTDLDLDFRDPKSSESEQKSMES